MELMRQQEGKEWYGEYQPGEGSLTFARNFGIYEYF
jgi:hypothetical protein